MASWAVRRDGLEYEANDTCCCAPPAEYGADSVTGGAAAAGGGAGADASDASDGGGAAAGIANVKSGDTTCSLSYCGCPAYFTGPLGFPTDKSRAKQ